MTYSDDRRGIGAARRAHLDAAPLAFGDIDIVEADAETADDLEFGRQLQQRLVDQRAVAHDQAGEIAHQLFQVRALGPQLAVPVHLEVLLEDLDGARLEKFRNDDVAHESVVSSFDGVRAPLFPSS